MKTTQNKKGKKYTLRKLLLAIKKNLVCKRCGSGVPNTLGECLCSYDLTMFAPNWIGVLSDL